MSEADVLGSRDLYKLITRQLLYDGYAEAANAVAGSTLTAVPRADPEGNQLAKILGKSGKRDGDGGQKGASLAAWNGLYSYFGQGSEMLNRYIGRHPKEVRSMTFSPDGQYVVAGDAAGTMQLYLAERMMQPRGEAKTHNDSGIARKYEGNGFSVEDITFHPESPLLVNGTRDGKINFYNYWKPRDKRPVTTLDGDYMIRSLAMHPTGHYLLAGTESPAVRLWDIERKRAFTPPMRIDTAKPGELDGGMINAVDYSPDGRSFVTGSSDGSLTIHDPSQAKWKVAPIKSCHSGAEVTSVQYSLNGNLVLTAGKDSCARIFDVRNYGCVTSFGKPKKIEHRALARYTSHDDAVVCVLYEKDKILILDRSMNDKIQLTQQERHTKQFRCLAASPRAPFFATGDDGYRMRFWTPKEASDFNEEAHDSRRPGDRGGFNKRPRREPLAAPRPMQAS
eukprot:TRINITY_DN22808_c0_g1_i1.p1 TRINITY_DN22808_c0_g1~~TRINITY_DN22808_c0_g1_i1.p1  ORF type:complete len:473 (+),score=174.33 TRINITY_DN22808_c0_g1_i1:71-1420(+)